MANDKKAYQKGSTHTAFRISLYFADKKIG